MNIPPIQDKGGQGLLIHDELRGLIQRRRQAAEQAAEDGGEDDDVAA